MYNIYGFAYIETYLRPLDKYHLMMVSDPFIVLLNLLASKHLAAIFASMFVSIGV
jgi:hypothetical protein